MLDRREFLLTSGAGLAAASGAIAAASAIPIIETHVHLWDLTRPQGAPFPPRNADGTVSRERMLPADYRSEMRPEGVVGAIAVECSSWIEDNLWLLEACDTDPIMVGVIGNLKPQAKEFGEYIERFNKHPLYLGIRYGVWPDHDIVGQSKNPAFINGLKTLQQADLILEVANPKVDLLEATVRISDAVPDLRIIVEHLGGFIPPPGEMKAYDTVLREFHKRPLISAKNTAFGISNIGAPVSPKLADHKELLDKLTDTFGEDRLIGAFGAKNRPDLNIMQQYYASKSRGAAEKYFWKNAARVYKWVRRDPGQPQLT